VKTNFELWQWIYIIATVGLGIFWILALTITFQPHETDELVSIALGGYTGLWIGLLQYTRLNGGGINERKL